MRAASAWLLVLVLVGHGVAHAQPAGPDYDKLKTSLAEVRVVGMDEKAGNGEVETRGTGFFISDYGYLVTAAHLFSSLPEGVHRPDVRFYVTPHGHPDAKLRASFMAVSNEHDYLVLLVDVSRHRVTSLTRRRHELGLLRQGDLVYTMGYPRGIGFYTGQGNVAVQTMVHPLPRPRYLLNMTLSPGQSGSPVFTADGAVVAVAIQSDDTFRVLTQATHAGVIADNWFVKNAPVPTLEQVERSPVVSGEATVVPRREVRTQLVSEYSDGCHEQRVERRFQARPGWQIAPSSVTFKPMLLSGDVEATVAAADPEEVVLSIRLGKMDLCDDLPSTFSVAQITKPRPGLQGKVVYVEQPKPGFTRVEEVARVRMLAETLVLPVEAKNIKWTVHAGQSEAPLSSAAFARIELEDGTQAYRIRAVGEF